MLTGWYVSGLSLWIYYCLVSRQDTIICAAGNGADVWKNHAPPRCYLSVRISVLLTEGGRAFHSSFWQGCVVLTLIRQLFVALINLCLRSSSLIALSSHFAFPPSPLALKGFCINWKGSSWYIDSDANVIWSVAHFISSVLAAKRSRDVLASPVCKTRHLKKNSEHYFISDAL